MFNIHVGSLTDYFSVDMGRQRNIHSEEHLKRLRKSHAERPAGFYRKGGKTRPITKKKPRKTRVIKKVVPRKGRYFYEYEDHAYETQSQARNVLEKICPPGKHKWIDGRPTPDSRVCSVCGLIQVDREFKNLNPKVSEWKKVDSSGIDMWVKGSQTLEVLEGLTERDDPFSEPYYYVGWMDPSKEFHELEAFNNYDDAMDYAKEWIRTRQTNPPIQVQRPSKPYNARWRTWITELITKAGEDPNLVDIHIHSDGVDIIPKWAPGSVFDREIMKRYESTMERIKAQWNDAGARWELRDLIPVWVNPQDGCWETDTDAAPKGAKAFYVTREELQKRITGLL